MARKLNLVLILFVVLLMLFIAGCGQKSKAECCSQCKTSWGQSPAAISAEGAYCGKFMTAKQMDDECVKLFASEPMTVSECEQSYP